MNRNLQTDLKNFTEVEVPLNHIQQRYDDLFETPDREMIKALAPVFLEDATVVQNVVHTFLYVNPDLTIKDISLFTFSGEPPVEGEKDKVVGFLIKVKGITVFHRVVRFS